MVFAGLVVASALPIGGHHTIDLLAGGLLFAALRLHQIARDGERGTRGEATVPDFGPDMPVAPVRPAVAIDAPVAVAPGRGRRPMGG